jgi:Fe-S cluster biogenesis protein NfuA
MVMTNSPDTREFQARLQRLDSLLQAVERFPDPAAREHTREAVRAVLHLHAAGLERLLDHVARAGEAGRAALDACARDGVVAGLLLLHGLHPLDLEARVRQALEGVRPALRAHGGNVEMLGVEGGTVRLRLLGSCDGCPSSAVTMRQTVEEAIFAHAPEITAVEVEAAERPQAVGAGPARVALTVL